MKILRQVELLWARLTRRQQLVAAGGAVAMLAMLLFMAHTLSTPDFKPLMTGMEPADVQAVSAQLAAKKIAFELTPDGKGINVAADQLDAARMEVASAGATHSGRMGFELFDKSSWGQTEFDEKVNYQRALEGELERTIGTLNGVKSARVHLVMPTPSVFLDRQRGAKASVTLRMKSGPLSREQLMAISRLVSGAVDDLAPADVTIVDAETNEALGSRATSGEGRALEQELAQRLTATLGPAVGLQNLRASVNVEYDLTSSEESQDKYDPAVSAVLTSQKSKEQVGAGSSPAGVAGTASNLPNTGTPAPAASSEDGPQTSSSENATFGVNKTSRHTVSPAGRIRRISAAILVNDAVERKLVKGHWTSTSHRRTQAQLDQLAELARGVLGVDKDRGDVVTVQNMAFDTSTDAEDTPGFGDNLRHTLTAYATPMRYAAMLLLVVLVWALMVRPVQKQIAVSLKELGPSPALAALPGGDPRVELGQNSQVALEADAETAAAKRELHDLVMSEPAAMTRTLQSWLRESNG